MALKTPVLDERDRIGDLDQKIPIDQGRIPERGLAGVDLKALLDAKRGKFEN